ncbi:MAG: xanthine dehydrogenase family protein subunit M [Geminicoccaceae bacterium]
MRPFTCTRVSDVQGAVRAAAVHGDSGPPTEAPAQFIAGGTTMLDLMKLGTMQPVILVDINDPEAEHGRIAAGPDGLRLGALVRMSEAADHPMIRQDYQPSRRRCSRRPAPSSATWRRWAAMSSSGPVASMSASRAGTAATSASPAPAAPRSRGVNRKHAVLGVGERCVAEYPGDLAPALVAFGTVVETVGPLRPRGLQLEELHRGPEDPHVATVLAPGEIITGFLVPAAPWTRRSL